MTIDEIKSIVEIVLICSIPFILFLIYRLTGTCSECKRKKRLKGIDEDIAILEDLYETRIAYGDGNALTAHAIEAGIIALKEKRKKEKILLEEWDRW